MAEDAAGRMGRSLDTFELKELLYANAESPIWDAVAEPLPVLHQLHGRLPDLLLHQRGGRHRPGR